MTGPALDPRFAAGLRAALGDQVAAAPARRSRRWRRPVAMGLGVLALAAAGGGAAVAAGWAPAALSDWLPGAPRDAALAPTAESVHTGSASIATGDAPAGTTSIDISVTCIDAGTLLWPDGSSSGCDGAPGSARPTGVLDLPAGGAPLVFTAPAGMRWGLTMTYIHRTPTDWAVNARGETYGAQKDDGSQPDLLAAVATDGAQGYLRPRELDAAYGPLPTTPEEAVGYDDLPVVVVQIPVYASDGTTVVGQFDVPTRAPGAVGRPADPSLDGWAQLEPRASATASG